MKIKFEIEAKVISKYGKPGKDKTLTRHIIDATLKELRDINAWGECNEGCCYIQFTKVKQVSDGK